MIIYHWVFLTLSMKLQSGLWALGVKDFMGLVLTFCFRVRVAGGGGGGAAAGGGGVVAVVVVVVVAVVAVVVVVVVAPAAAIRIFKFQCPKSSMLVRIPNLQTLAS